MMQKNVIDRLTRIALGALFVVAGAGKLLAGSMVVHQFETWGLPFSEVLPTVVGIVELLCGIALVIGRSNRLASAPVLVIMLGATLTHLYNQEVLPALFVLVLVWLLMRIILRRRSEK